MSETLQNKFNKLWEAWKILFPQWFRPIPALPTVRVVRNAQIFMPVDLQDPTSFEKVSLKIVRELVSNQTRDYSRVTYEFPDMEHQQNEIADLRLQVSESDLTEKNPQFISIQVTFTVFITTESKQHKSSHLSLGLDDQNNVVSFTMNPQ